MHSLLRLVSFSATLLLVLSHPFNSNRTARREHGQPEFLACGYKSCPRGDPSKLNVHLVAHTHDDVGWLKTVDQYFYGMQTGTQRAGVQYILDSVIPQLVLDPTRRFIYVETAFFWKWWRQQSEPTKLIVTDLVANGRLEFIGGGWSMNDEATVHYNSVIDQMTWGHRRLTDEFGKCGVPRVAWQIDPFGHSREQASLFAQMYFDGLFFGRLDYNDKSKREIEKKMEFVWQGSDDLGRASDLFTGVLPNGYGPPGGFCFDDTCGDDPIVDDPESEEFNVKAKVDAFIDAANNQAKNYATNHIVMTMGSDFQYQNAGMWFKNLDKVIKYVNKRKSNVNVFYSTPSCYLLALNGANKTWSTKSDDFFPYASDPHAFWTGYFTSRPATKFFERRANNYLQTCKQLQSVAGLTDSKLEEDVISMKEAMGINQHHDAVSGTEKQHVANDYALQLNKGVSRCENVINGAYSRLLAASGSATPQQVFCHALNISECAITETKSKIAVTLYNPRAQARTTKVRLPWTGSAFSVRCPKGHPVKAELVDIPQYVQTIPGRTSAATQELLFEVELPPLGFGTYFVEKTAAQGNGAVKPSSEATSRLAEDASPSDTTQFNAKTFSVFFDSQSGALKEIKLSNGNSVKLSQDFRWYQAMRGDNSGFDKRASGAYVFRPNGTAPTKLALNGQANFTRGDAVNEVHQIWAPWLSQTVRVYTDQDRIEFDWVVGPVPVGDNIGKEIVTYFESDLATTKTFFTDANGRQILKRVRDYRPTWPYSVIEPVSGNYYPVNSRLILRDEKAGVQLSVLTDRSQGGTSMVDGAAELMLHRRTLDDDAFGVGEALNEPGFDGKGLVVRGTHVLLPTNLSEAYAHRDEALGIYMAPLATFAEYQDIDTYRSQFKTEYSALTRALPPNVHLLTLEQWTENTILLRLEHFYDSNDDPANLSKPVIVSLAQLFEPFGVLAALETTLSANQVLAEAKRLQWRSADDARRSRSHRFVPLRSNDFAVHLKPMQIRTFVLVVKHRFE